MNQYIQYAPKSLPTSESYTTKHLLNSFPPVYKNCHKKADLHLNNTMIILTNIMYEFLE